VIPNASVTLDDPQTGSRFETKTNGAGLYIFPSVKTGGYKLTVSASGLEKREAEVTARRPQHRKYPGTPSGT
jgi:hypothetical protein